jgi:hypothetical protein
MGRFDRANVLLGLLACAGALAVALLWVPMDTNTGLIEKVRRQVTIGDALAPALAAGFILLGGLLVLFFEPAENAKLLTAKHLQFLTAFLLLMCVSFMIMRWSGPAIGALVLEEGYRPMRDTAPWKYIGFILGGVVLIAGLIALVEGRVSLRGVALGLLATIALIVVYDLPFDDLLLPPNGDV